MSTAQVPDPDKRQTLKRIGAGTTAAGATIVGGSRIPRFSPVGRARAVHPAVIIGFGAAAAVNWAVHSDWDPLSSDSVPEGLTVGALKEQTYQTARTRQSTNRSTFVDNRNLVNDGLEHAAYGEGKKAAIEKLNEQETKQVVKDAATAAVEDYETTVKRNLLKTWNESIAEVENLQATAESHPDVSASNVIWIEIDGNNGGSTSNEQLLTETYTLPNGEEMDLRALEYHVSWHKDSSWSGEYDRRYTPMEWEVSNQVDNGTSSINAEMPYTVANPDGDDLWYLQHSEWRDIWNTVDSAFTNVKDGIIMYVDKVYGEVQAGDLDTADLFTPRELAQMTADDEDFPQAIADLMALNIPVDLEREATITVHDSNATIEGRLTPTSVPSEPIAAGDTIDPTATDEDYYITYDMNAGSAEWGQYEPGVDGGVVTFTAEPYADSDFEIATTAGETATVVKGDFTDQGDGTWTVDISDQVETAITEIDTVTVYAQTDETEYTTVQLDSTFTVNKITDSDGNEHDEMEFTQSEPQDDTNYITQEEWDEMLARQEELIDKYEEAKEDDGGGDWFGGIPGTPSMPDLSGIVATVFLILGMIAVAIGLTSGD